MGEKTFAISEGVAFSWSLNTSRDGGLIVDVPRDSYSERGMRSKVSCQQWATLKTRVYLVTLLLFPPQLRYTVNTPMDYGSVSCSVAAEMTEGSGGGVGPGRPCVYHIVPAGKGINNMEALVSQIIIAEKVGPECLHCKSCCRSKWPQPSWLNVLAYDNDLRVCFQFELSERCLLQWSTALLVYFSAFLPRPPKRLSSSSSFHSTHDIHPIPI